MGENALHRYNFRETFKRSIVKYELVRQRIRIHGDVGGACAEGRKKSMKIYLGADHAGFALKEALKKFLQEKGYEVVDKGAFSLNPEDDYPDFIEPVASAVASDPEHSRGVIIGGSGEGEAIDANRFKGVRAAVYYGGSPDSGLEVVKLAREHNDANVLSIGARFISEEEAKRAAELFLNTKFSGGRHKRRIEEIDR